LHGDLSPVNQVFNMTVITSGNFFSTNCDVDYSKARVLSYLVAGLIVSNSAFNSNTVCGFFAKVSSLSKPKQRSHMDLNQDYLGDSSVHMRNDQEIGLRRHASRKCDAESLNQHSLYATWLHPA
jgi:hypothetical protein